MGFWEVAKNVGTGVANRMSEKANEIRQLREKYDAMSDQELMSIANSDGFFGSSSTEKGVAFSILRSRGYSENDIGSR